MSFSDDLKRFSKKTGLTLDEVAVTACSELTKSVIIKTPADTGSAKANWQASLNRPINSTTSSKDKNGTASIAKAISIAEGAAGNIFYLANNLPYIRKLEFGGYGEGKKIVGGFSKQAPQGMVRLSMQQIKNNLRRL
jgi:hypothetical protein